MQTKIIAVFFVMFIFFTGSEGWCTICPDAGNLKTNRILEKCPCENNLYIDLETETCTDFFNCNFFSILRESNIQTGFTILKLTGFDEDITKFVEDFTEMMTKNRNNNLRQVLSEALLTTIPLEPLLNIIGLDITRDELMNSPDMNLIKETVKKEIMTKNVTGKYEKVLQAFFNPFLLSNKKINHECHKNPICIWTKILDHNKETQNQLPLIIENLMNDIIPILEKVKNSSNDFCHVNHCIFLRHALQYYNYFLDLLTNVRNYNNFVSQYILNLFK